MHEALAKYYEIKHNRSLDKSILNDLNIERERLGDIVKMKKKWQYALDNHVSFPLVINILNSLLYISDDIIFFLKENPICVNTLTKHLPVSLVNVIENVRYEDCSIWCHLIFDLINFYLSSDFLLHNHAITTYFNMFFSQSMYYAFCSFLRALSTTYKLLQHYEKSLDAFSPFFRVSETILYHLQTSYIPHYLFCKNLSLRYPDAGIFIRQTCFLQPGMPIIEILLEIAKFLNYFELVILLSYSIYLLREIITVTPEGVLMSMLKQGETHLNKKEYKLALKIFFNMNERNLKKNHALYAHFKLLKIVAMREVGEYELEDVLKEVSEALNSYSVNPKKDETYSALWKIHNDISRSAENFYSRSEESEHEQDENFSMPATEQSMHSHGAHLFRASQQTRNTVRPSISMGNNTFTTFSHLQNRSNSTVVGVNALTAT